MPESGSYGLTVGGDAELNWRLRVVLLFGRGASKDQRWKEIE